MDPAAAAAAHAEFESRAPRVAAALEAQGLRPACRAGCAHCCRSLVSVLPQEAFALAAAIDGLPDGPALKAAIRARAAEGGGRPGLACPCLDPATQLCRIHPARPLTCRGMNSTDAEACRAAEADPARAIPTLLAFHRIVQSLYDRAGAALAAAGLPSDSLEMTGALAAVWETPEAEARWRAGEEIFAGVRAADRAEGPIPRFG